MMGFSPSSLLLLVPAALAIYKLVSSALIRYQRASKARALGCEDPLDIAGDSWHGIGMVLELIKADKEWLFPDFLLMRYNETTELFGRPASTFRYHALFNQGIYTTDPRNIQAVLATNFDDYYLGPVRRKNMMAMLGDGIFVQDGTAWSHSRAMLRPSFVRAQVADLELEERHLQNLMLALPTAADKDGWTNMVDLQTLFFRLTIDSATEFLFGHSVLSQLAELPKAVDNIDGHQADESLFAPRFESGLRHLASRFRLGDLYWMHNPKEFREDVKSVQGFVDTYVRLALQSSTMEKTQKDAHNKERYVFAKEIAKQTQDPVEIRAQLLNILLAGRDTTASMLSYLFHHLVRNQEVFAKLRTCILDEFGTYDKPRGIDFASLKSCTYLQYCLNETLRINTVVPANGRVALRDTVLPTGGGPDGTSPVLVPKGQGVEFSVHVLHRRKDIWGQDADLFRPERWEGRRPGWEFLPFSGGPRICIGQQFALTEVGYVAVRLLQKFDRVEAAGDELTAKVTAHYTLTVAPGKGPMVRLREARQ